MERIFSLTQLPFKHALDKNSLCSTTCSLLSTGHCNQCHGILIYKSSPTSTREAPLVAKATKDFPSPAEISVSQNISARIFLATSSRIPWQAPVPPQVLTKYSSNPPPQMVRPRVPDPTPCALEHLADHHCPEQISCEELHLADLNVTVEELHDSLSHKCPTPEPCRKAHLDTHKCKTCTLKHLQDHTCKPCVEDHLIDHTCDHTNCDEREQALLDAQLDYDQSMIAQAVHGILNSTLLRPVPHTVSMTDVLTPAYYMELIALAERLRTAHNAQLETTSVSMLPANTPPPSEISPLPKPKILTTPTPPSQPSTPPQKTATRQQPSYLIDKSPPPLVKFSPQRTTGSDLQSATRSPAFQKARNQLQELEQRASSGKISQDDQRPESVASTRTHASETTSPVAASHGQERISRADRLNPHDTTSKGSSSVRSPSIARSIVSAFAGTSSNTGNAPTRGTIAYHKAYHSRRHISHDCEHCNREFR
jgi:hypothetical protein